MGADRDVDRSRVTSGVVEYSARNGSGTSDDLCSCLSKLFVSPLAERSGVT